MTGFSSLLAKMSKPATADATTPSSAPASDTVVKKLTLKWRGRIIRACQGTPAIFGGKRSFTSSSSSGGPPLRPPIIDPETSTFICAAEEELFSSITVVTPMYIDVTVSIGKTFGIFNSLYEKALGMTNMDDISTETPPVPPAYIRVMDVRSVLWPAKIEVINIKDEEAVRYRIECDWVYVARSQNLFFPRTQPKFYAGIDDREILVKFSKKAQKPKKEKPKKEKSMRT